MWRRRWQLEYASTPAAATGERRAHHGREIFTPTEDQAFTGQVLASDAGDTLIFAVVTNPAHGTLTINAAGAFTYTPQANFFGSDTFSARVTDSANQRSPRRP